MIHGNEWKKMTDTTIHDINDTKGKVSRGHTKHKNIKLETKQRLYFSETCIIFFLNELSLLIGIVR